MAKGNTCPSCGKHTFHQKGPVRVCSKCKCVGWYHTPEGAGSGKGKECHCCGNNTLHKIRTVNKREIRHCTICYATVILA